MSQCPSLFHRLICLVGGLSCILASASVLASTRPLPWHAMPVLGEARNAPRAVWSAHVVTNPVAVAVDERIHRAFVLSQGPLGPKPYPQPIGPGSVDMLDAATGRLLRTARVGVNPVQAALDTSANRLYVLSQRRDVNDNAVGPGSVSVLDAATGALVRTTQVGVGVMGMAVDDRRGRVFALTQQGGVDVLDAVTGRLLRVWRRVAVAPSATLAVSPRAGHLFVALGETCPPATNQDDANPDCLQVYDDGTGRLLRSVPLSETVGALGVDDLRGRVVATLDGTRSSDPAQQVSYVALFAIATGALVHRARTDPYGSRIGAFALSVTAGRAVVVGVASAERIGAGTGGGAGASVVDTGSGRVLRTEAIQDQSAQGGYGYYASVAIDAPTGHILILTQPIVDLNGTPGGPAALTVLDARTGRTLRTLRGQTGDVALGLDSSSQRIFVANNRSNTVRALDAARL